MILAPGLRRLALLAHVVASVGFLGAVATFLVLAVAGLTGEDALRVRAAYLAGEMVTWGIVVPLSFASLLTGLVVSLGTNWGLVRHYWVLIKLLITVFATIVLMIHTRPVGQMAQMAAEEVSGGDLLGARIQLIVASGAAVLALLLTTSLSIYKPRGLTRYGWRTLHEEGGGNVR